MADSQRRIAEFTMSPPPKQPFRVGISQDGMSATIRLLCRPDAVDDPATEARAALDGAGIAVNAQVKTRLAAFLQAIADNDPAVLCDFPIAAGQPPTEGVDGEFLWAEGLKHWTADWSSDAPVDFYELSSIVTVEADAVIGTVVPPIPGEAGIDVHGRPIAARPVQPVTIEDGVRLADDGMSALATIAGRVTCERLELRVLEIVEVPGNVDFSTGNLNLTTDCAVGGTVRDLFKVKSSKNVTIGGAVEAATVEVTGDLTVRGGILNRGRGRVACGGQVVARFCDEADLHAAGEVRLAKAAIHSRVHTDDRLIVSHGTIIGGNVYARKGVEAHTLGSEANVKTEVWVGLHADDLRWIAGRIAENERRQAKLDRVRGSLAPLMAELRRLTTEQRDQVTELMHQAESLAASIAATEAEIAALQEKSLDARPGVLVTSRIFEGVTIVVDGHAVPFAREFRGPTRIERRKLEAHTAVVAFNQQTGAITELPARPVELQRVKEPAVAGTQ
jgi:hypothetical protein